MLFAGWATTDPRASLPPVKAQLGERAGVQACLSH